VFDRRGEGAVTGLIGELPLFAGARLAGVDEAGRGPLAGPVVAAAVVFGGEAPPAGLADSKTLAPAARERLAREIRGAALSWAVAWADPAEIDRLNILEASMLAMQRAVLGLGVRPEHVQVDGNRCPRLAHGLGCTVEAIVRGDGRIPSISAASILAKVARDAMMVAMDARYPGYGFDRHKGYPTAEHLAALASLGPCPIHRRSFRPVSASAEGDA
jgi:ribonuclease HII